MLNVFISFISLILLVNFITFPAYAEQAKPSTSSDKKQTQSLQPSGDQRILPSPSGPQVEIGGTGSGDFYNYYDPESQTEVWGVRTPRQPDQQTPAPPIFVNPEIKWPYPQENIPVPPVSKPQNPPISPLTLP